MEAALDKTVNRPTGAQPAAARTAQERPETLRMYLTAEGRLIELPPGMTHEEAAAIEADGRAAQQRLSKRPAPQPVPIVLPGAPRMAAKPPPRPDPRRRERPERRPGERKTTDGEAARTTVMAKPAPTGTVAQYLVDHGMPVLARGATMLARLKRNEQTHDNAGDKLKQSEDAVIIPVSEDQANSSAGQVTAVESRADPSVEERKAKSRLDKSLAEHIPRTLEDVDNFKGDRKAQHMGADVMAVVQEDKNAVALTFGDVSQTPPPTPSGYAPSPLPQEEAAPETPTINLGQGAIAPLKKEHTDVTRYARDADDRLKAEGLTQQQLDMVDSGELAEANKEKKGLEQTAKTEPIAVEAFARQESDNIDKDLARDERAGRDALRAKRKATLGATAYRQKGAKNALEKKRDEVAAAINAIYQATQTSVTKKLADLETQAMKRFDDGNAAAARAFEDNVKREFDAYKADRYSGWFGWARRAKDWLLGMDELPGVKKIFERNRRSFVDTVNRLVGEITADNQRVIQQCRNELTAAKTRIKEYVDRLSPGLKEIGTQAAAELRDRLNDLDQTIGRKEEELRDKLKDKQAASIKAIDEKIEKMKEAMSGALAKLGKLLLLAAKKFFTWALGKFGFSLATIESIINKGAAVLKAIFTGPIQFVKNLIRAASAGFQSFGKNFLTHLKNAVFEWLTGSLQGVTLPGTWDLKGILSVVFQLLGLTYQNIRAHLVKLIPEPVVKSLETGFSLVKTLVTEGPMAAWEQLKEIAGELRDQFVEKVKDWIKLKLVQKAIETILSLFIPGAGIIRAIIGIYDTVVFFIQKAKEIMQMVGRFLGSIAEIAAGNIAAAAAALEEGLARGLKLVIAFLAKFLRIEGITNKIREVIQTIRSKVDAVIAKVAAWVVGLAKKGGAFVAAKAREAFSWAFARAGFAGVGGERHTIYFEGDEQPRLMIASDPKAAKAFVDWYLEKQPEKKARAPEVNKAISNAFDVAKKIAELKKGGAAWKEKQAELLEKNVILGRELSKLIGDDRDLGKQVEKYKLEGLTGTYGSIPKPPGDDFTADHQPQAAVLVAAAKFRFFSRNGELIERSEGRAKEGFAINLHKVRHAAGATYGAKGKETKEDFLRRVKPVIKDKPAGEQRQLVVNLIQQELRRDVAAMKSVVRAKYDNAIWGDVISKAGKGDPGQKLVGEIRSRIIAGEDQIANQDLKSLVE